MNVEKVQVNVWMPKRFVELIDETAKLTGSTRSDLLRRAAEHYLCELKRLKLYVSQVGHSFEGAEKSGEV